MRWEFEFNPKMHSREIGSNIDQTREKMLYKQNKICKISKVIHTLFQIHFEHSNFRTDSPEI
jgi:hypothetical protein